MKNEYVDHGKFGYREPKGVITPEYIARVAGKIKVGDKITWMIPTVNRDSPFLKAKTKKEKLTVTGKTRYLIIANDAGGRMHTIRIADLAAEKWRKEKHNERPE